jgi:hypothetical protein
MARASTRQRTKNGSIGPAFLASPVAKRRYASFDGGSICWRYSSDWGGPSTFTVSPAMPAGSMRLSSALRYRTVAPTPKPDLRRAIACGFPRRFPTASAAAAVSGRWAAAESREVFREPACERGLLFLELHRLWVRRIPRPRQPDLTDLELREGVAEAVESGDVILVRVRRDDDRERAIRRRGDVSDHLVDGADVAFRVNATVHEDVPRPGSIDRE